jgi:hypothetical protein
LLSQVGQTAGPGPSRSIASIRKCAYSDENFDTYYQLQLAIRYNF